MRKSFNGNEMRNRMTLARAMLYSWSFTTVHSLSEVPMAEKQIKDLSVPSKISGDVKGGAKLNRRSSKRSR